MYELTILFHSNGCFLPEQNRLYVTNEGECLDKSDPYASDYEVVSKVIIPYVRICSRAGCGKLL